MDASCLVASLRRKGFGVTNIPAEGGKGPVTVIYTVIDRSDLARVSATIRKFNPRAFYTIEDIRQVREGIFPGRRGGIRRFFRNPAKIYRYFRIQRRTLLQRQGK